MNASRFFLYGLVLLLALLAIGGIYGYQRLPMLLEQQAEAYLYEYGVRDVGIGAWRASLHRLQADRVQLRGERDGLAFDVSLTALQADYDLLAVWRGGRISLSLADLDIALRETGPAAEVAAAPVVISELSPHALLAGLPLDVLSVERWRLDYRPLASAPVTLSGSLQWTGHLDLPFAANVLHSKVTGRLRSTDSNALQLALQWLHGETALANLAAAGQQAESHSWQWSLDGSLHYAPLLAWLRRLQQNQGWPVDLSAVAGLEVTGASEFEGAISHPDTLRLPADAGQSFAAQFEGSVSTDNQIEQLGYAGILAAVAGTVPASLDLSAGKVEATLGPAELAGQLITAALQLPEETQRWLRWGETLPWRWRIPGQLSVTQVEPGSWSLQLVDNRALLGNRNSQLRWEAVNFAALFAPAQPGRLETTFSASLNARLRKNELPQLQLALQQRGSSARSEFELVVADTVQSLEMTLAGSLDPGSGHGKYRAELRSLDLPYAGGTVVPLLQKFGWLSQPVELLTGSFSLSSDLQSTGFSLGQLQQQAQLRIESLSGSYGEYGFEGIELAANWTGVEQWQTRQPVAFAMARLDVGFDITDTRATVHLPQATPVSRPVVRIDEFEAGMFGGRVFLPEPRSWDFASESNSTVLRAEQWRLADMVALQQGQDIQAQGLLEGELPVTISDGRLLIEQGYLRARPPGGSIRYIANAASRALTQRSAELGLALGLLEDFSYQTLSSEVELDRAGNLLLGLSLEGSNPAHYDGRSIRFNINLEQNLDPLLQSLRLSDSLVEKVEKRLH